MSVFSWIRDKAWRRAVERHQVHLCSRWEGPTPCTRRVIWRQEPDIFRGASSRATKMPVMTPRQYARNGAGYKKEQFERIMLHHLNWSITIYTVFSELSSGLEKRHWMEEKSRKNTFSSWKSEQKTQIKHEEESLAPNLCPFQPAPYLAEKRSI